MVLQRVANPSCLARAVSVRVRIPPPSLEKLFENISFPIRGGWNKGVPNDVARRGANERLVLGTPCDARIEAYILRYWR